MAQGAFFKTRVSDLRMDEEHRQHMGNELRSRIWNGGPRSRMPVARFKGFAFVVPDFGGNDEEWMERTRWGRDMGTVGSAWLILEVKEGFGRKGFLDVWDDNTVGWKAISCEIDPSALRECEGKENERVLAWHDRQHLETGARGGLWYRGRSREVDPGRNNRDFDDTFTTLSGGRALAENLALDRDLILGRDEKGGEVPLAEIKGVTVAPIPWEERMPDGEIAVDSLAMKVPEDQHVLIVPSLQDLFALTDRLEETGTPVLGSFAVGSEYRDLAARYKRQMGLDLPQSLAKMLPVKTVAVTGGDPFLPTGSDVAVILETEKEDFVFSAVRNTMKAKARRLGAETVEEAGVSGFRTADRSFSAYAAQLDGAVVVSNSAHQIARLQAVVKRETPALGASEEYRFFRHRYPVGKGENAYVFISDACLRRWAGPKMRIGASRRSRALAALAGVTAGRISGGDLDQQFEPLLGKVKVEGEKVLSPKYGSLGFVTPIGELDLKTVTRMEKDGYDRWRRGYESGWARFFDPIAIQFRLDDKREEIDMTILPLRVNSDYDEIVSLAGKALLSKGSMQVPGESVFHFAMAVDKESELFRQAGITLVDLMPSLSVNPLGWMGESLSVTLGNDLVWQGEMDESSFHEMPVLVRVDVESRLKLALFMTALKGAVESASPGLVDWETRKHGEQKYVVMKGDQDEIGIHVSLYYATLPTGLLVSLNEEMLKRAIDREAGIEKNVRGKEQVMVQSTPQFLTSLTAMGSERSLEERRRGLSYAALPVLNEWYKSHDAEDPVAFHRERFARSIECPGGKGFRWNGEDLTMESVVYGHPGRQKDGAKPLEVLERFKTLDMKGSFEDGGLRIKVGLDTRSTFAEPESKGRDRPGDDEVVKYEDLLPLEEGTRTEFRTESDFQIDEPDVQTYTTEVLSATETDGGVLIEEKAVSIFDDMRIEEHVFYEVGPNGYRLVKVTGDTPYTNEYEGYEFPAEVWPGQKFRTKTNGVTMDEGRKLEVLSDTWVSVIDWEMVEGPDGVELKALKIETREASVYGREFSRSVVTEWYAPGMGVVKSTESGTWGESKGRMVKFEKPE